MANPFTKKEQKVVKKLVEAENIFITLDRQHPSETKEWEFYLHGLQKILSMRILRREHPDHFPDYSK